MKIIIENNINFKNLLQNLEDSDDENDESRCKISQNKLDKNKITLECGHSFNFITLYNELLNQKDIIINMDTNKPNYGQIKCPYCRQMNNSLLPHVRLTNEMKFITGINSPENLCMSFFNCNHKLKSGPNKGMNCPNNGFYIDEVCFCRKHHSYYTTKQKKITPNQKINDSGENNSINKNICQVVLKHGNNKGKICGKKINDVDKNMCNFHFSKSNNS